jgi:hypothetical protein
MHSELLEGVMVLKITEDRKLEVFVNINTDLAANWIQKKQMTRSRHGTLLIKLDVQSFWKTQLQ